MCSVLRSPQSGTPDLQPDRQTDLQDLEVESVQASTNGHIAKPEDFAAGYHNYFQYSTIKSNIV